MRAGTRTGFSDKASKIWNVAGEGNRLSEGGTKSAEMQNNKIDTRVFR
jgi:hypothetical protein